MNRSWILLTLTIVHCLVLLACSGPNTEAPQAGQVHEPAYIVVHAQDAQADMSSCKSCHKSDLSGGARSASCLMCHPGGDPITIHPLPYGDAADHGPAARDHLSDCLACHGTAPNRFDGGVLADPDLYNIAAANCSAIGCHSAAGAHPTRWQGTNDITGGYQASHRGVLQDTINTNCALCHQVVAGGPQPRDDAPSCFSASFTNADGSTTGCHTGGSSSIHEASFADPALHGAPAKSNMKGCQTCHGTPGGTSFDGGSSEVSCRRCHNAAGAHPTRWQGTNDITDSYQASHRGVLQDTIDTSCTICHDVVQGRPSPNVQAPSCFSATFTNADGSTTGCHVSGGATGHVMPYTNPQLHGADAKANLRSCVPCHATPADAGAGGNPRFNRAVGDLANGCEDCHAPYTAHPTPLWTGVAATSHKTAKQMSTNCALCHGINLDGIAGGGIAPACITCHTAGSPLALTQCSSCHNWPPDAQAPAGNQYPNRGGVHAAHNALAGVNGNCAVCHQGAGTGSEVHFNGGNPATVAISSTYNAQSGSAAYNSSTGSCSTTSCHGGQNSPTWFGGTLDVDNACASCHTTSAGQYNSATSGQHQRHVEQMHMACTVCHSTALLQTDHFSNLSTTGFEGAPWETLNASLGYSHAAQGCEVSGQGCNVAGCHSSVKVW